ncbi:hypothetical protein A3Q56_02320 [Intoshia linei]|uniref:Uncharacterized protein n=1 Tax=Intoshia linei TaxID=1819745 RepID=A0A177B6N0_9BILA|nr:hypothetical protein A3Q56_02320 [Intoshia linei]
MDKLYKKITNAVGTKESKLNKKNLNEKITTKNYYKESLPKKSEFNFIAGFLNDSTYANHQGIHRI